MLCNKPIEGIQHNNYQQNTLLTDNINGNSIQQSNSSLFDKIIDNFFTHDRRNCSDLLSINLINFSLVNKLYI